MARNDTISSTEKLLDLIRRKNSALAQASAAASPPAPDLPDLKARVSTLLPFKKKISVGVSIGYNDLKLVKIGQTSEKNQELLAFTALKFPPGLSLESPQFPKFLKGAMTAFCGHSRDIEIWSAISSAKVEMRYLRIPKVPRRQIANTVYWTFRKEVSFNEKEEIFDFDLLGDAIENGIRKTEVMSYTAPKQEINRLQEVFSKTGFTLTGISIVPFLLQNLLRSHWLETEGKNACSLYIGRDWSRIDIFAHGNLVLSRGIKAGMRSMVEAIRQQIIEEPDEGSLEPDEAELDMLPEAVEGESLPGAEDAQRIFSKFIHDPTVSPPPSESVISEDEVFRMIMPALERLVRQVDRTLEHYALKFDSEGVDKIYISGPINTQQLMVNHIGGQLGLQIDVFDPMAEDSPISGDITPPESLSEREAYLPAVGMALSNNSMTPNFIYTYKDKEKASRGSRLHAILFAALMAAMVICIGVFLWQSRTADEKEYTIARLQRQLDSYSPRVDQKLIQTLLEKTKNQQSALKSLGKRYKGVAVINEVSRLTPAHIRLLSIRIDLEKNPPKKSASVMRIEGIISGDRLTFESSLVEYLVKLENSPLFGEFGVKKRTYANVGDKEVMRFTAQVSVI